MPRSNPVIRRYTPPTCTLEVLAENSPLSKWMNQSVLKQVRFELRLDDPRLPEDERITIRGDRDQLESLCQAVRSYVQQFLQASPDNFWDTYGRKSQLGQPLQDSHPTFVQENLPSTVVLNNLYSENNPTDIGSQIYLRPNNHLTHNLFLGNLVTTPPQASVQLSLLQLFDLATALDEYGSDVVSLPSLGEQQNRGWRVPSWAPIAAVLALGVGLTPLTLKYVNDNRRQQTASNPAPTTADQQVALESNALPTVPTSPQPGLSPSPGFPALGGLPATPLPGSPLNFPGGVNVPNPQLSPNANGTVDPNLTNPTVTGKANPSQPGQFVFPNAPVSGGTVTIPNTVPAPPNTAIGTSPTTTNPKLATGTAKRGSTRPNLGVPTYTAPPSGSLPADIANLPPSLRQAPPVPPPLSRAAGNQAANQPSARSSRTGDTTDTSELIRRIREGKPTVSAENTANRSSSNNRAANSDATLFDTPQVSEARKFLSQRWQPPAGLNQTLEYSLMVGVDGTIERILPLGNAARTYVDRTGMPLIGEPFVSPNRSGQSIRIRAVFTPDGKVKTFAEND